MAYDGKCTRIEAASCCSYYAAIVTERAGEAHNIATWRKAVLPFKC